MGKSAVERLRELREGRADEKDSSASSGKSTIDRLKEIREPIVKSREKEQMGYTFGIDTFDEDLNAVNKTLNSITSSWQTQETMVNTKASIEAMKGRIEKYQNYQQTYGGTDLSNLVSTYKSVLDDWDMFSETYGYYQNADAYNTAKQKAEFDKKFEGLTFDDVQKKLKEYKEGTPEYDYLSSYTNYSDLSEYEKAIQWEKGKHTNAEGKVANSEDNFKVFPSAEDLGKAVDDFNNRGKVPELDVMGLMTSLDKFQNGQQESIIDPKKTSEKLREDAVAEFDSKVGKDGNLVNEKYVAELEKAYNLRKNDNLFDYHKHYMEEEDFEQYSSYDPEVDNQTYKYINDDEYGGQLLLENSNFNTGDIDVEEWELGYDHLTDDEKATYNFIFKKYGEKKAQKFLDDIEPNLRRRKSLASSDNIKKEIDEGTPLAYAYNAARPMAKLAGSVSSFLGTTWDAIQGEKLDPYATYNEASNSAAYIQEHTANRIEELTEGMDILGTNVPSFLYNTGSSITDTALGVMLTGKAYTAIAGSSAFQQKARELTEAGENQDVIWANALGSGFAEMLFEYVSIDKLLNAKNADSLKQIFKNALKQAGVEGFEEGATELSNIWMDNIIRGDNSEVEQMRKELLARGFTEKEASKEIDKKLRKQFGEAVAGGFLSGAAMGGVSSAGNYSEQKQTGSMIRDNDRVQNVIDLHELMEIQGLTPEESEAYKLYGEYVGKGFDADNISNARLGNLYNTANAEAYATLKNKKSTEAQKTDARKRIEDLSVAMASKTKEQKAIEHRITQMHTNEKTTVNGADAKIEGIRRVEGDTLVQTNQGEVSIDDMTFTRSDAELIAHAENMPQEKANLLIEQYDGKADVDAYVTSFNLAYNYGKNGLPEQLATENKGVLTDEQVLKTYSAAYKKGMQIKQTPIAQVNAKHQNKDFEAGTVDESAIDYNDEGKGEINWSDLNESEQKQIAISKGFANVFGVNVKYFVSKANAKGEFEGDNGYFDPTTNTVYIDVHAGRMTTDDADSHVISTMSHEITHWAENKAPELHSKLSNHVMDTLMKETGKTAQELIDAEKVRIQYNQKKRGDEVTDVSDEYAMSEIVARACEDMLRNSAKAKEMLNGLSESEQKSFITKIKETIQNFIDWANDILSKLKPRTEEARIMQKNKEAFEKALKMWEDMQIQAIQTNQSLKAEGKLDYEMINEVTEEVGVSVDADTQSAYPNLQQFSERTWTESEYVQNREKAIKGLVKALGITKEEAGNYIDNINGIAKAIADDRARLDYEPNIDERATVVKPNSEYVWTVDMSTLCAKRLLFTGTFDEIQRQLPNTPLGSDDIVTIRAMMKEDGLEVACGICYVESTRREIGTITNDFIERYKLAQKTGKSITRINSEGKEVELKKTKDQKETTADKTTDKFYSEEGYTPTLAELNTTDIDIVKRDHPLVYEAYLNYMNARGQAKPKLLETRAEYKGEILTHFKTKNAVNARNRAGGLRLQSFSDFEVPHLIDMMQIIIDMARVGLKSQAYTKVVNFAEAFGNTGVKINLSLIAKDSGLDADGNLIFDDVEGINHEEAFRLRDKYSKNVGTILVGKNDEHIIKAMADPRIDYIIPFHKSSWKESLYDALGLNGYDDYTDTQNEKPLDKDRKIKNFDPSEYWDFNKTGDENAQIYLEKCKADGRIPKFPQFQGYEGYWKLLIDFKMYDNDGVGSPQTTVTPDFNMEECNRILNEYKGGHRSFPVAKGVVDRFVSEYKQSHPQTQYSNRGYDDLNNKIQELYEKRNRLEKNDEFQKAKESLAFAETFKEKVEARKKLKEVKDKLGYTEVVDEIARINEQIIESIKQKEKDKKPFSVSTLSDDDYSKLKSHFGTTNKFAFAGYMLKDGDMLDFSGKHWGDKHPTTRTVDHRDVKEAFEDSDRSGTEEMINMISNGNIRIMNETGGINLSKKPTEAQRGVLERYISSHNGEIIVDIDAIGGDTIKSFTYNRGTTSAQIFSDIDNYFRGGNQSDLMRFHTQYSDREIDSWLDALSIDDLLAELDYDDFDATDINVPTKKKERAKRRVDEVNKRLKAIGLTFNGTKSLAWTDDRIDKYLSGNYYGSSNPNYAQAYITYMTPQQFLNLTAGGKNTTLDMIENESQSYGELDIEKLGDSVPLFLDIKEGRVWSQVQGHEGRHRMYLLGKAGFEKVPVLLFDSNTKYNKTAKAEMKLIAQRYNDKDLISKSRNVTINDVVPFSTGNRELIVEKFGSGNNDADIHYSSRNTLTRAEANKLARERVDIYKRSQEKRAKIDSITEKAMTLNDWLRRNSKDKHIPETLKPAVAQLINAIDFSSKQYLGMSGSIRELRGLPTRKDASITKALAKVREMMEDIDRSKLEAENAESFMNQLDVPKFFLDELRQLSLWANDIADRYGDNEYVLNKMTAKELESLDNIVGTLKQIVTTANKSLALAHTKRISEAGDRLIADADSLRQKKMNNLLSEFLEYDNITPYYFFKRLGDVGVEMFEAFLDAQENLALLEDEIEEFAKNTFTAKESKEWSQELLEFKVLDTKNSQYKTMTMTVAHAMSVYALSRREAAQDHLLKGGGIRINDIKLKNNANKIVDADGSTLSRSELNAITDSLTDRQKEVAEKMQEFMSSRCSELGNDVSMKRFGIKQFKEKNYFPMVTIAKNGNLDNLDKKEDSVYRLLNMDFTKSLTPNANNQLVIDNIFDVFASHTTEMAKYNTFALPMLDAIKILGYKYRKHTSLKDDVDNHNEISVMSSLRRAFGDGGIRYITNLMKDMNGAEVSGRGETIPKKLMSNYKVSAVGGNLRVVLLQGTSYVKSALNIEPKYLIKAMFTSGKKGSKKAMEHSGIALWKSKGHYDLNIARSVASRIKQDDSFIDKAKEASLKLAGFADSRTWGHLWNASEYWVQDNTNYSRGSEEFNQAVANRFREIIVTTQVVDSVLTRTQLMRSKSAMTQTVTAFMSEGAMTYNMLTDAFFEWSLDARKEGRTYKSTVGKHGKKFARSVAVFVSTTIAASLVGALADAGRDDDEEKEFAEKYVENLIENLKDNANLIGTIPILKDLISISKGFSPTRFDEQSFVTLASAYRKWIKVIEGDGNVYQAAYKSLQGLSQLTGLPASNLVRDVVAMWNTSIGEAYPSLKIK